MSTVTLESSDKVCFTVQTKVANMSKTLSDMNQFGDEGHGEEKIPIANVRSEVLQQVITWLIHHVDDKAVEQTDDSAKSGQEISEWDENFMKTNEHLLGEIILASNFLDIVGLTGLGCKMVARMIEPVVYDPEAIRKMLNITCDYTEEELKQVELENSISEEL